MSLFCYKMREINHSSPNNWEKYFLNDNMSIDKISYGGRDGHAKS